MVYTIKKKITDDYSLWLTHYHKLPHFDALKIYTYGKHCEIYTYGKHCEKRRNCL